MIVRAMIIANLAGMLFLPLLTHLAWLDRGVLAVALVMIIVIARNWGMLLPALAQLGFAANDNAGMRTAQLYMANIAGATTGSVLTGFVLMQYLSLINIAQLLAATGLFITIVFTFIIIEPYRIKMYRVLLITVAGAVALGLQPIAAKSVLESLLWKGSEEAEPSFLDVVENRNGIITVDNKGTVYGHGIYDGHFNIDPINDTNGIFRPYALNLMHPSPREVLMIGFSSGSWAQVVANNVDVSSLTIVEINPGYTSLVAKRPEVASVLDNPKVNLIYDDGRRWLRLNPNRRFDAIILNTTYHFRANATNLLSTEFLAILKNHLYQGGIAFYNTTDSDRVQRTGCTIFSFGARFDNHLAVSESPIQWDFRRWRASLEDYRIDGNLVFDLAKDEHRDVIDRLMLLESHLLGRASESEEDQIEPCPDILDRTTGEMLVTDDNMGTEWRHYWGVK